MSIQISIINNKSRLPRAVSYAVIGLTAWKLKKALAPHIRQYLLCQFMPECNVIKEVITAKKLKTEHR